MLRWKLIFTVMAWKRNICKIKGFKVFFLWLLAKTGLEWYQFWSKVYSEEVICRNLSSISVHRNYKKLLKKQKHYSITIYYGFYNNRNSIGWLIRKCHRHKYHSQIHHWNSRFLRSIWNSTWNSVSKPPCSDYVALKIFS